MGNSFDPDNVRVREAIVAAAKALVDLSPEESWHVLDSVSIILPRRAWMVGDNCEHDGDPTDGMVQYIAAIMFRSGQAMHIASSNKQWKDLTRKEKQAWVDIAMKQINEVRPPWVQ